MLGKKEKIFCVGSGKTGTTSIEKALNDFGYKLGSQKQGELFINDYASRNFKPIIKFCKTADAFQDAPFCFQHTFIALDQAFSNAKFILTIRDNDTVWYNSLVNFHTKLFSKNQNKPTWEDLDNATYRYKGYVAQVRELVFGIQRTEDPYNERKLRNYYNTHNASVLDYFKNKNNLLVLNVAKEGAYKRLCEFLNKEPKYDNFPWENRSSDI